jgi:sugar phosphate isomerase/epimerase
MELLRGASSASRVSPATCALVRGRRFPGWPGRRSDIVASGSTPRQFVQDFSDHIRHVHVRDAEPGYIHHSVGNGQVDFADTATALAEIGYQGKFSLELETRDISNDERPEAALKAGRYLSSLL